MEQTCLAFVVTFVIGMEAAFTSEHYQNCSDYFGESMANMERCEAIGMCLAQMYVYGDFQNGVYIKRGTSASDAIDEYCTSLQEFDESLQDKWGYLKEAGCSKRNNRVELITDDGQILVTTELWYDSRSFLRYIYDIACSRIPPPLACPEILSNYTWRIVNCVRYTYIGMPPGLIEMLIGGPETYFDKQMFCGSVLGLEACLYDAVTDACNTPMRTRHDLIGMMGELYTHAQSVLAMAQCNGTVATPHTHTGKSI